MNEEQQIQHMIEFIEKIERDAQALKVKATQQNKSDTVKAILDELERITDNED